MKLSISRHSMVKYFQITSLLIAISTKTFADTSRFFANAEVQKQEPKAFVLQPETEFFVRQLDSLTQDDRLNVINDIKSNSSLYNTILTWRDRSLEQKIETLKLVFNTMTKAMNITPPNLIIDDHSAPNGAYFDFDLAAPDSGTVMINSKILANEKNPYSMLLLLIHETRHSAQFQRAFLLKNKTEGPVLQTLEEVHYKAAFKAQKELKLVSYCDFLTLTNEFEAFQFANFVLGELTNYKEDIPDMGTYASQYKSDGKLKIDLVGLFNENSAHDVLEKFNILEQSQYDLLKGNN